MFERTRKYGWSGGFLPIAVATALLLSSGSAVAKPYPYSAAFVAQVQPLFFDSGHISNSKVDTYIARLKQKREEIRSLHVGEEALSGNRDPKKIAKKIDDEAALEALDLAAADLEVVKTSKDEGVIYAKISNALELEGALRVKGLGWLPEEAAKIVAHALQTWTIPKNTTAAQEASDLYDPATRSYLSVSDIQKLKSQNADLSIYSPGPSNPTWEDQGAISQIDTTQAALGKTLKLYGGKVKLPDAFVFYYDGIKHSDTKPKMNVYTVDGQGKKKDKFKLKWGAELHSDPTSSALMMTLGFASDVTQYARDVKVYLGKAKLSEVKRDWEEYYSRDWVRSAYLFEHYVKETGKDAGGDYVIFKDALVEAKPEGIERLGGWNMSEFGHTDERAFRALGLIQLWLSNTDMQEFNNNRVLLKKEADGSISTHLMISDVGATFGTIYAEKPDRYPWTMVSRQTNDAIELNFHSFQSSSLRNSQTVSDARWTARLLAQLTRKQYQAAVDYGSWPECMRSILVEKLISRRNDLITQLGLIGARQPDGSLIQLIPQAGPRENYTIPKLCDVDQVKEDYTTSFKYSNTDLFNTVNRIVNLYGAQFARMGVGHLRRLQISGPQFGLSKYFVGDVIVGLDRSIERNPNPSSEANLYLLKDRMEIGFRLGAAFGVYKDFIYTRAFTLVYPVRSIHESQFNNGFLVNLLLPNEIKQGPLPEKYVLMTEHYFENGAGIQIENPDWLISPVLIAGGASVRLSRSIYDHRDPAHYVLYRDRSNFTQAKLEALVRLFIFKIPVFRELHDWGRTIGRGSVFSATEAGSAETVRAITRAMTDGDFAGLAAKERSFDLTNDFNSKERHWQFLFWSGNQSRELDQIVINDNDETQTRLQFRTERETAESILGKKRQKSVSVEAYADGANPGQYQLDVRVMSWDTVTRDKNMDRYLSFINGLSVDGKKVINLDPALGYTTNKNWGSTVTTSDSIYTPSGVAKIISMTPASFWNALAASIGVTPQRLEQIKKDVRAARSESGPLLSASQRLSEYGVGSDDAQMLTEANRFLKRIADVRKQSKPEERMKNLAEAIRSAIFVGESGFYSSRLLGAINRIAGAANIYSKNMITRPPFTELDLLESVPMYGEVGKPIESDLRYVAFKPVTGVDLYTMFDSWF